MLHAGNGARVYARSAFEVFGGNAGQRNASNLIACRFPGLSRHAQHRALAGPCMADQDAQIAPIRDMGQRIGLLARQDKIARFRTRQGRYAVYLPHVMALPFCHERSGAVQALFGLDHLAGREAILAASVVAEFDQILRTTHRAHDLIELVDPVAVPVRKLRYVALREGRLLLGDRVQPKGGIGDDPRAIAARDLAVHLGAVGFEPFALDAPNLDTFSGRTDLALWLQRDALGFEA